MIGVQIGNLVMIVELSKVNFTLKGVTSNAALAVMAKGLTAIANLAKTTTLMKLNNSSESISLRNAT
ncbi:MAG: hypothetical protein B0W54_12575 [Cellvibrio sp. 79]|nr:MAG: hypothetical protein B0W54_12575 [Cellvibrio sp. 79]